MTSITRPASYDDWFALLEDGPNDELIDGDRIMTPAPTGFTDAAIDLAALGDEADA